MLVEQVGIERLGEPVNWLEYLGVGLILLAFGVAVLLTTRLEKTGSVIAWAWFAQLASGVIPGMHPDIAWVSDLAPIAAELFPVLLLSGTLVYVEKTIPIWLIPTGLVFGLLRSYLVSQGYAAVGHLLVLPFEILLYLACAWFLYKAGPRGVRLGIHRALIVGYALLTVPETAGALHTYVLDKPSIDWLLWILIAPPLVALQIITWIDYGNALRDRSQRESAYDKRHLEEHLKRFLAIMEHANDIIFETSTTGEVLYVSPSVERVLGYEPSALVGHSVFRQVHPDDLGLLKSRLDDSRINQGVVHPSVRVRNAAGDWRWIEVTTRRYQNLDGVIQTIIIGRDVTSRRESEQEALLARERFKALAEKAKDVIVETDSSGFVDYTSPNIVAAYGYPTSFYLGKHLQQILSEMAVSKESSIDADSGRLILEKLRGSGPHEASREIRDAYGRLRWVEIEAVTYHDPSGVMRAISITRDVTERVQLQEQLRRGQKLESLGILASGVAHDFNNLLVGVLGNADLARMDLSQGSKKDVDHYLKCIVDAAKGASELTQQLLTYAGKGALDLQVMNLTREIELSKDLLVNAIANRAELALCLQEDISPILGDKGQVQQILINLVVNAAEACGDDTGRIEVRTGETSVSTQQSPRFGIPAGRYALLQVEDNGAGMSEAVRSQVFDPFFTTKFAGRGLGLAAVFGIVQAHGGQIHVESEWGRGTTFKVYLPVSSGTVAMEKADPLRATGKAGLVLLIDDEDSVLKVTSEILQRAGYQVIGSALGSDGIEQFRHNREQIQLIILDLAMPELDGRDVYEKLKRQGLNVPVLMMSGYNEAILIERMRGISPIHFIQKPFDPIEFLARVGELLEHASALNGTQAQPQREV